MNLNKLSVLFVLAKHRTRKDRKAPIMCRLTYKKKRKQFSTGLYINPTHWNSKMQKIKRIDPNRFYIRSQLSLIKTNINKAFLVLQMKQETINVDDIFKEFKGKRKIEQFNTIEFFNLYLDKLKELIGIDIQIHTWKKFEHVKDDLKNFISLTFKKTDIPMEDLDFKFLNDFEHYLKTKRALSQITVNKAIQRFRKPIRVALAEGYIKKDPFTQYRSRIARKEIVFLTVEELSLFENHVFSQQRLQLVKNLFVFCCYTGLAYKELMSLKSSNITLGFDNNLWINLLREKTQKSLSIPILPKAQRIIDEMPNSIYLFPRISNQKYNSYLKEIGDIIGLEKKLTTHMARRTFASTVLLYNDVPMEIVSELLGHSSVKVTQESYAKVVKKKISQEMERLKNL